jgi:CBS domain containing-hemolysin-like protein
MIDVVLKFIVLFFLFLGYLIFLFSYRVFNGTSTRLILLSKFEDEDNANLIPELNFSQSTIRILVGIWSLGLAIHTIFIFYFYSNILLNSWLGALIYFFVSLICPLFGYFIVFSLNHKAVEKLIGIPKFILILTVLLLNLSVVRKFSSSSNGNNNEEKDAVEIDALEAAGLSVDPEEMKMIQGILRMDTVKVREIMRPRVDMITVESNSDLNEIINLMIEDGYSKIPVIGDSIDDILGIVYARDVLKVVGKEERPLKIQEIIRPAIFVPESQNLEQLLHEFQKHQTRMAIIIDEHGGISGLVTVTDLIEEIVGELVDEFDVKDPDIQIINDSIIIVDARMTVADLNEEIGTSILVEGFDTIGGLVYKELGKMPEVGDHVEVDNLKITVQSTIGRRIGKLRLYIKRNSP